MDDEAAVDDKLLYIRKNGSTTITIGVHQSITTATGAAKTISGQIALSLAAGDYVELLMDVNAVNVVLLQGSNMACYFGMYLVRRT